MEIANEILRQLGGAGRLKVMINAKNFVGLAEGNQPANGLQFAFMKGSAGINMAQIRLNGNDLYDVRFMKQRGMNPAVEVAAENDVFVADLADLFWRVAGLAIRL
jgi:3-deoxy-D-manno-octulosonate 8-phosphate phosphatase KdsC-like HAD superfamily phosphatase